MSWSVLLIIFGAFVLNTADVFLKESSRLLSIQFAAATLLYGLTLFIARIALRSANFASVLWIWAASAVIMALITSVFYYHDPISRKQVAAFIFAILAIICEAV
jgi:hypothetical protein